MGELPATSRARGTARPSSEGEEATLPRAVPSDAPPPVSVSRLPPEDSPELAASITHGSELSLRRQDAARAQGFARVVVLLCAGGLLGAVLSWAAPLAARGVRRRPRRPRAAVAARTWWVARQPIDYGPQVARVFGAVAVCASLVVAWYLGVLSPAPMLVVLGVSFFAMSDDRLDRVRRPGARAGAATGCCGPGRDRRRCPTRG